MLVTWSKPRHVEARLPRAHEPGSGWLKSKRSTSGIQSADLVDRGGDHLFGGPRPIPVKKIPQSLLQFEIQDFKRKRKATSTSSRVLASRKVDRRSLTTLMIL